MENYNPNQPNYPQNIHHRSSPFTLIANGCIGCFSIIIVAIICLVAVGVILLSD